MGAWTPVPVERAAPAAGTLLHPYKAFFTRISAGIFQAGRPAPRNLPPGAGADAGEVDGAETELEGGGIRRQREVVRGGVGEFWVGPDRVFVFAAGLSFLPGVW